MKCTRWAGLLLLGVAACTYGPEEHRVVIGQVVQVPDTHVAFVVVQHERFQQPTGLSRFPGGGKPRSHERSARLYLVNAHRRTFSSLTVQAVPDSLWGSFSMAVAGLEGDSVAFLLVTGCDRNGECHPELRNERALRVTNRGEVRMLRQVPPAAKLPGVALARRPGEVNYVRMSVSGQFVTARFEEDARFVPVFEARSDGSMAGL